MFTGRPAPLKNFDYIGFHRYSLTFCTESRRPLFVDPETIELTLGQIARAASERDFAVLAYCFMRDHLHLLVHGTTESANCKKFVALAKQYSGYAYAQECHRKLWQRYGYERTLRKDEDTLTVARYIVENPVRRGLVAVVDDYPFAGSLVCDKRDLLLSLRV